MKGQLTAPASAVNIGTVNSFNVSTCKFETGYKKRIAYRLAHF